MAARAASAQHSEIPPLGREPAGGSALLPPGRRVTPHDRVTPLLESVPAALQRRQADASLAARVGRQCPDPFDVLFERHWARLRTYCLGILGSADDAQDAAQESMVRAYRRLWRTKDVPPVKPLLFAIARNVCIDRLRERSRQGGPVEEHHLPAVAGTDEIAGRRGRLGLLVADLRALSERQRTALVLREACGLSHGEIAETLETTPARVKSLISEARRALFERRAGRELSCEEYRRALVDVRGRLRNQSLLAHRSTCARCGEAPSMLYVLGLPGLALTWLLRSARGALTAVGAPVATPTAAKLAVAVACLGTATVPVAQMPDVRENALRTGLASVAQPARLSRAPIAPAGRRVSPRAEARLRGGASVPGVGAPRGARAGKLSRDSNAATDRVPGGGDLGPRRELRDAVSASVSALPARLRDTVAPMQRAATGAPRRAVEATPSVSRVVATTVRAVERALQSSSGPAGIPAASAPNAAPELPSRAVPDPSAVVRGLVPAALRGDSSQ